MSQLLEVIDQITFLIDDHNPIDIIYLDFCKAFDTVPHERLLIKLEAYGIVGNVSRWIRNFLSGRCQRVRVNDKYSSGSAVRSGIPQGSILGPVLFTVFINDLPDLLETTCKIFADDTKLYDKASNHAVIQRDLDKLQEWSNSWQLLFNADKCKVLHVGKGNTENTYNMNVNGVVYEIKTCEEEKDLGVIFDKTLVFDVHVEKCINKANGMIGLIKRTFTYLDKDVFLKLYKALVRPHLEYGNIIWHPKLKRQSIAIERVQRRATRLLKDCTGLSYSERLRYLNLHSLKGRRLRGDLIETYKIYHGLVDVEWSTFFAAPTVDRTRNSEGKIFVKQARTNLRSNVYSQRVVQYWNSLPYTFKHAKSLNSFKNLLDVDRNWCNLFVNFDE